MREHVDTTETAEAGQAVTPYRNQLEFIEGLRLVVRARRGVDLLLLRAPEPLSCFNLITREEHDRIEKEMADVAAASKQAVDRHRQRALLARDSGVILPLDRLAVEHGLDEADLRLLELVLVQTTDLDRSVRALLRLGSLVCYLSTWERTSMQDYLPRVLPGSPLERSGLVRIRRRCSAPALWKVYIPVSVLVKLIALWPATTQSRESS